MKKVFIIILSLVLVASILVACGNTSENEKELVVGMELAYPPFEMTDEEGNPTGISIDMAYALGEYLDRPIRIENMAYNGLVPALQSGKVDLIISSMTINEERMKTVDFSNPYANTFLALLINKDSSVNTVNDLGKENIVVAVKKGTTGYFYVTENFPNAEVAIFDNENACVLEVVQGRADVFIYDQMSIYKNWQLYLNDTRVVLEPFQENPEQWGIALQKGEVDLKEQINIFIEEYKGNGFFDDLAMKYLQEIKQTFDELEIQFFF